MISVNKMSTAAATASCGLSPSLKLVRIFLLLSVGVNLLLGAHAAITRSTGLVSFPETNEFLMNQHQNSNYQNLTSNVYDQQFAPTRIRILLTRNISNLDPNSNRMKAPEVSYFGAIGIGKPVKMFNVAFDTASSETWLPYYNWFPFANNLHYSDGYSCRDSSTCKAHKRDFTLDYRHTTLTGETYEDLFTLFQDMQKDDAQFMVAPQLSFEQNFLGIENAEDEQFRYKPYDGIVGLAPVPQSASGTRNILLSLQQSQQARLGAAALANQQAYAPPNQNYDSPNQNMMAPHYGSGSSSYGRTQAGNQIASLVFAFWFNPNQNSRHGGELMLGGVDEHRFSGDLFFHRISSWFEWQLPLTYVMLGGQVISCSNGCRATLDTNANSIVGPRQDVEQIYTELQAQYNQDADLWLVDCNKLEQYPLLVLKIEETRYPLLPSHYIKMFRFKDSIVCHMAIKPWDNQNWLLGTSFIGAYYTVFDFGNRRVGFATPTN